MLASHIGTATEGRARPDQFTRESFAEALLASYENTGRVLGQWSVFLEVHPLSRALPENNIHFHALVETTSASRWAEVAQYLRTHYNVYAHVGTCSARQSYWSGFAYLYAPSAKKTKDDIDESPLLSPGHDTPPQQISNRREGIRRLQGTQLFDSIQKHSLKTPVEFYAFAARQYHAGDRSWLQWCMTKGEAKVKETLRSARLLATAQAQEDFRSMSHLQILEAATGTDCICEGRAVAAWDQILRINGIDSGRR